MRPPARIVLAASISTVALLGLTACTQPAPLPSLSPSASSSASAGVPVARIAALAVDATGTGSVVSVHDEALGTLWDVVLVLDDGSEQELHLTTAGRLVAGPSSAPTSADDRSANRGRVAAASIELPGAVGRMTAAVRGGRVTAIALTTYQDRVVWRGDVLTSDDVRHDVVVDAVNGAVLANLADQPTASGSPTPGAPSSGAGASSSGS